MKISKVVLVLVFLLATSLSFAQSKSLQMTYGLNFSQGDWSEEFKNYNSYSFEYIHGLSNNLGLRLGGQYILGNNVGDNPLEFLLDDRGLVIGTEGALAKYSVKQRGYQLGLGLEYKILDKGGLDVISDFQGKYMVNWLRIQDDNNSIFSLYELMNIGLDRRSAGFVFSPGLTFLLDISTSILDPFVSLAYDIGSITSVRGYRIDEVSTDSDAIQVAATRISFGVRLNLQEEITEEEILY